MIGEAFSEEQKHYLDGFVHGSGLSQALRSLPVPAATSSDAASPGSATRAVQSLDPNLAAQDRALAAGGKLCAEEQAKRRIGHGLDIWDEVLRHARDGRYPRGTDVFLFKFQGLFYVAPAQDSFMCRLRLPGGIITSHQFRGVAALAEQFAGGFADVTTRANLQLRQISAKHTVEVLMGLHEIGIINRGAGADNIRNITCSPTAGIDPQELIDTRPLARAMHHHILNHRELYGLPRKFNIAFDGGGRVSALEDTNDIGFAAVKLDGQVVFHLTLGGITGHRDFARGTGIVVAPEDCIAVADAIVRSFIDHGDRTDRRKARLKYVLERMGLEAFIADFEKRLSNRLRRVPIEQLEPRPAVDRLGHIGFHEQKQPGLHYVGVVLPVGRMNCAQMRAVASMADRYGSGTIRLTVWQNLLISDIPAHHIEQVEQELEQAGLTCRASSIRAGLVACTGSAGCKYASADTKQHAMQIAEHLESRLELDVPINIHLTGCPHSCAQHYIGDIGLLATKVPVGQEMLEGYHVFVGGGYGAEQAIGREVCRNVVAEDVPATVERMLRAYLSNRVSPQETFAQFVRRMSSDELSRCFGIEQQGGRRPSDPTEAVEGVVS
ncbi:NirA family protein [Fontivita pretiosa]|uniref:NirA family protein n=1 Tax=Fontivita pretiosa TaxID=2989684 RepID=UPI003D170C1E